MDSEKDDIERYRDGSLEGAKRNALEKKAFHDPFLADALEGAESVQPEEFSRDLRALSKSIKARQAKKLFIPFRIAAGIAILIGAGSIFYYFLNRPEPLPLALEKSAPAVSAADSIKSSGEDSSSNLLSLAKPGKTSEELHPSPEPIRSGPVSKLQSDEAAGAGHVGEQATEKTSPEEIKTEEEKSKVAIAELREENEVLLDQSVPSSISSGAANQKKDAISQRDSKSSRAKDKEESVLPIQNISGKVTATDDDAVLQGVNITVKGSTESAVTDQNGNYQLTTQEANPQLVFSSIGLERKEVTTARFQPPVNVQLSPDRNQRSELNVAGGAGQTNGQGMGSIELAQPIGGRDEFQRYLEANVGYPERALTNKTEGSVTVQFTIHSDGSISNLETVHGIGDGCEEELMRVIQQGPKWTPTALNRTPQEDKVTVLFRFILPR